MYHLPSIYNPELYMISILTSRSHMLLAEEMDEWSFRLMEERRVGVIMVETARFRGDGTPFIVIARLNLLPNLYTTVQAI